MNTRQLLSRINKNGFYIQIGSNDGVSNDEYGLKEKILFEEHTAIFVEPIKEYFDSLKRNYENSKSKIFYENIAITEKEEKRLISLNGMDTSFVREFDGVIKVYNYIR